MKRISNKTTKYNYLIISIFFVLFACSNQSDKEDNEGNTERAKALADYNNYYMASETNDFNWDGDAENCKEGSNSDAIQNKVLMRINYFRRICGLNDNITFDKTKNDKCLKASLMMQANNRLSHSPTSSWKCYSVDGKEAAGKSNLYLGRINSSAISGYIDDPGSSNIDCGHRRWILYSKAKVMGHGATSRADALWVIGGSETPEIMPEYIPYPGEGYFPAPLVYSKWSLGVPGADFSNATVEMTGPEGKISNIEILSHSRNGYGDNTFIWQPEGIQINSEEDIKYTINIKNVIVDNETKSYQYDVIIFNPDI